MNLLNMWIMSCAPKHNGSLTCYYVTYLGVSKDHQCQRATKYLFIFFYLFVIYFKIIFLLVWVMLFVHYCFFIRKKINFHNFFGSFKFCFNCQYLKFQIKKAFFQPTYQHYMWAKRAFRALKQTTITIMEISAVSYLQESIPLGFSSFYWDWINVGHP